MVILLASGCGLVAAALQVRYRDIAYVVPFALQFLLYASPVGYRRCPSTTSSSTTSTR